ncbi:MAG: hypothetical protein IJQ73_10900 [Kiritimatiellae bacterium]|nr:hypothetical protein [Kiritimatiellia bacterium]
MKKSLAIVSAALAAASAFALPRKAAEITVSGYTGASTLENFPVLVRISPERISGFSYADCAEGGADISFVASDGETILAHEVDTWNPDGESLVWVRVPSLSGTATAFTFRWKDANPPSVTASDVWSAGYAGVWHLGEAGAGGTSTNSTANGSILDGVNTPTTVGVAGKVGGGRRISDSTDTKNAVGGIYVDGSRDCTKFNGVFTISGWFWHRNQAYYYDHLFYKREASGSSTGGIAIEMNNAAESIDVRGGDSTSAKITTTTFKNKWSYLMFVYNGTKVFLYQDGVLKTSASGSNVGKATDNNLRWVFGNDTDGYGGAGGDISWKGVMDEVRLRAGTTSADWAKAEYASMASDTFLTYGAAETLVSDGMLGIFGDPAKLGSPTPPYGAVKNLSVGDPVALSMASTAVPGRGRSRTTCAAGSWRRLMWTPARAPSSAPRRTRARQSTAAPTSTPPTPSSRGSGTSATVSASAYPPSFRPPQTASPFPSMSPASATRPPPRR